MFKKLSISHKTIELCAPVNASYSVTSIYQKKPPNLLSVTRHKCMENKIFMFDFKMMIVRDVSCSKRSKIQKYNLSEPTLGFRMLYIENGGVVEFLRSPPNLMY